MSKGRLRRRGARSWQLKFDVGRDPVTGRRKIAYKTIVGTKHEAQAALTRALAAFQDGNWIEPHNITVADYLKRWLTDHAAPTVSAKTCERYGELVANLSPFIGVHKLQALTPLHVQGAYSQMLKTGRLRGGGGLSAQTVHSAHRVLFSALRQAVRWQLLTRNVCDAVVPPKPAGHEIAVLDDAEVGVLLKAARDTRFYMAILVAAATGLRRSELLALRWSDIDFARARLEVNQAIEQTRAGIAFKQPKTKKSRRAVSLPAVAVESLRTHRVEQAKERLALGLGKDERALVFTDVLGEPVDPRAFSKGFGQIVKRAGVTAITFHGLRHSHITSLLRRGVHPKIASERAGHSSTTVTMDIYSHALPSMQDELAFGVDAAIRASLKD